MRAHQVTGLIVGLGVIVVAGLVGRRYVSRRVGLAAAFLAAIYPGFWVLEVQILSEPLGLLIGGLLMLVLAHLWQRPSLALAVLAGGIAGALALVRSEQALLLVIAVAPLLLLNGRISFRKRLAWTGIAALAAVMVIAPWTIYNLGRFEDPVILSTNMGGTVLVGNCPPTTYSGELLGGAGGSCGWQLAPRLRGLDQSQAEREYLSAAFDNMRDNIDRLPVTVLARHGRMLAVFRPAQTVDMAASWFGSERWPVWAWVTSFWLLVPLAVAGSVHLRRARVVQWPLLAPVVIALLVVTIAYGEPRYHTPADLGVVVLGAVGVDRLVQRTRRRTA
jgi:4-amino-4-deoxy-L-arabinose transferase-like glycosyltransferase